MGPSSPQTYEAALKRPSWIIWPGCGDGRNRWCGRVHDYCYAVYDQRQTVVHQFRCVRNHESGCPQPKPEPDNGHQVV